MNTERGPRMVLPGLSSWLQSEAGRRFKHTSNTERNRAVAIQWLTSGMTAHGVGKQFNISRSRVEQITAQMNRMYRRSPEWKAYLPEWDGRTFE
jgi:DNA-directed RNA polymerase sigma subunit (sigma70/sigma32)